MSHLIVFDMEWNMGYQTRNFDYHGVEQVLRGEVIQIGAVRMDGQKICDTFQMTLKPRIFRKLHYQIAKVTGLTQQDINNGVPIAEGLRKFREWCGEDAMLGEWGMDDIPVLKQNLFLVGQDEKWPGKWFDLQKVFISQHPCGEGETMKLESVVNRLGIETDGSFHDALADAMYTARVMQHIDIGKGLAAYPDDELQLRKLLCPEDRNRTGFVTWNGFVDGDTWKKNPRMKTAVCPDCGNPLIPDDKGVWVERGNNCMYSMGTCKKHGPVMVWMRRSRTDGLHYRFARATEKADEAAQAKWVKDRKSALERNRIRKEKEAAKARLRVRNVGC